MLCPDRMARMASSSTGGGTGVSHTPWARLMPPMRSHSVVMARISDWMAPGDNSLSDRRDAAGVAATETEAESKALMGAVVCDTGKHPLASILQCGPILRVIPLGVRFDTR